MGTFLSDTLGAVHKGRPQRGGRGFVKSGRGEGGGGWGHADVCGQGGL